MCTLRVRFTMSVGCASELVNSCCVVCMCAKCSWKSGDASLTPFGTLSTHGVGAVVESLWQLYKTKFALGHWCVHERDAEVAEPHFQVSLDSHDQQRPRDLPSGRSTLAKACCPATLRTAAPRDDIAPLWVLCVCSTNALIRSHMSTPLSELLRTRRKTFMRLSS